jgi:hypothetical protein
MQLSVVFTLADKYRTSAQDVPEGQGATVQTAHGTLQVLEARHARGGGKEPLAASSFDGRSSSS